MAAACVILETKEKQKKCFNILKKINIRKTHTHTLNEIEILRAGLQTSSALRKSGWKSALPQNACLQGLQGLSFSIWITLIKKNFPPAAECIIVKKMF